MLVDVDIVGLEDPLDDRLARADAVPLADVLCDLLMESETVLEPVLLDALLAEPLRLLDADAV